MNTNIDTIQKEISQLFGKYKIPAITKNLPPENLQEWSMKVAVHFKLDEESFRQAVTDLFWSVGHVQLSLGYALIARQDCKFPKGTKGKALHEKDVPDAILMPEIHFWYHIYNSYECIYRCWERITSVIGSACYPGLTTKIYYDQLINKLSKDKDYKKNPCLKALTKQIKHWNKAAEYRNKISHGKSSPFRNMTIEGKVSKVLGSDGHPIVYLDYSVKSPINEIKHVVGEYRKILSAIIAMKDFIDHI